MGFSMCFHGFQWFFHGVHVLRGFQRVAYRRANGGTSAPSVTEDVEPRFVARRRLPLPSVELVVRKTFLELPEQPKAG